ncbi:MAG: efflux transporter outer membrane subunit [Rubrivivax sp.]|nr:efflux transporter outer membrane subunit [Rubrivivax sp.]
MNIPHRLAAMLAALVLAGCASVPALEPQALPVAPAAFKQTQTSTTAATPQAAWWLAFADAPLADLQQRAERSNNNIRLASARLAQARAVLRGVEANRAPQLGAGVGAAREALPGARPATLLSVGANLSYEVDLAGRLAQASSAAELDARQQEALLREAQLLVQAELARSYFALRALDAEHALVLSTVAAYRATLQLTERRFAAGDVPELDVARVRSELAATESDALALQRQRSWVAHAIAVLVGESASTFSLPAAEWSAALPQVPAGLPSSVLARRPDVAAAQSAWLAAQARVGVAQNAWWPSLTLTAAGGQASPELSDVFKWSARNWGVGALLSLPIFDGGRREAGVASARADLEAALARYREQALVAFKDVEDELAALHLLAEQAQAQARAVGSAERVTLLSESRYRNGLVSQLELLDARRSELRNRRQALQVRAAQYQSTIGLIRALGGGWGPMAG